MMENQFMLQASLLRLLYAYQTSPQNPNNEPMKISDIARAVVSSAELVQFAFDAWKTSSLFEYRGEVEGESTYALTETGVGFVKIFIDAPDLTLGGHKLF